MNITMTQPKLSNETDDINLFHNIELEVLGDRIRRARLEKKWSQRDLSSTLFTSAYLSALELGKTRPTYKNLIKLAERLDKPLEYFLRSNIGIGTELNEEQTLVQELRLALLQAQTKLEMSPDPDQEAETGLDEIKAFLPRLSNTERARYYLLRGRYFNKRNLPTDAIAELEEAHKLVQAGQDTELVMQIEFELGVAHYAQRRIMPALTHFLAALTAINTTTLPHEPEQVQVQTIQLFKWKVLVNTGRCYLLLNNPDQAIGAYKEALDNPTNRLDLTAQAQLHYEMATVYNKQGDYARAALSLGRSLQIYQQVESQATLLTTYNRLAELYAQSEQYQKAEVTCSSALKLARSVETNKQHCEELNSRVTLAVIYQGQNKLPEAQAYLQLALDLRETCQDNPIYLSRMYRVAGEIWTEAGNRPAAQDYFQQALAVLGEDGPNMASTLSEVYHSYGQRMREWGEIDEAFKLMEQAYRQRELSRANRLG